jgi:hypothetical protein
MRAAQLPEKLRTECYCPSCCDQLLPGECADPWAICLACKKEHRFFIMPESPLAVNSGTAASRAFAELAGRSHDAVARFWLSDPAARSVLNEQLALILRAIAEGRRVISEPLFSFCSICGGELSEYESDDIYVQGLRCPTGHNWSLRGGYFRTAIASALVGLQAEYSDAAVCQLVSTWLKGSPGLDQQVHASIRHVLADFLSSRAEPPQS